jgi:hypothetical protein
MSTGFFGKPDWEGERLTYTPLPLAGEGPGVRAFYDGTGTAFCVCQRAALSRRSSISFQ